MTIERGQPWGTTGPLPDDAPVVDHDAHLARLAGTAKSEGWEHIGPVGLLGGDLCRTVGGLGDRDRLYRPEAANLVIDVLEVWLDGRHHLAAAHVVIRRPGRSGWWNGPLVAVMNAQFRGVWDVAPRSHPNDGRADVVSIGLGGAAPDDAAVADLTLGDRYKAWRRLPSGTHVPHPRIAERRVETWRHEFDAPMRIELDAATVLSGRSIEIRVIPDAITIVV